MRGCGWPTVSEPAKATRRDWNIHPMARERADLRHGILALFGFLQNRHDCSLLNCPAFILSLPFTGQG
jgi:hypothetical protein